MEVVIKAAVGEEIIAALFSATELPLSARQRAGGRCHCCFCISRLLVYSCSFSFACRPNMSAVPVDTFSE